MIIIYLAEHIYTDIRDTLPLTNTPTHIERCCTCCSWWCQSEGEGLEWSGNAGSEWVLSQLCSFTLEHKHYAIFTVNQLSFAIKHKLYALFTMDQFSFILKNELYALFNTKQLFYPQTQALCLSYHEALQYKLIYHETQALCFIYDKTRSVLPWSTSSMSLFTTK